MTLHFDGMYWCAIDATGTIRKADRKLSVIESFLDWWENDR